MQDIFENLVIVPLPEGQADDVYQQAVRALNTHFHVRRTPPMKDTFCVSYTKNLAKMWTHSSFDLGNKQGTVAMEMGNSNSL